MASPRDGGVSRSALLFHPDRLRIVQVFLNDRCLTVADVASRVSDVPIKTLYRHISMLQSAGVLEVVSERAVRGAKEKTLRLVPTAASVGTDDLADISDDDLRIGFQTFLISLLADFDRFLPARESVPVAGVRQVALNLTKKESATFAAEIGAVLARWIELPESKARARYNVTIGILPAHDP